MPETNPSPRRAPGADLDSKPTLYQVLTDLEAMAIEAPPRVVAAFCEAAIKRFGPHWELHWWASQVYEGMMHWGDAIRHWQALVRWAPLHAPYHYRLGRAFRLDERYQEAMEACWWAWQLSSEQGDVLTMHSSADEMQYVDELMMARLQGFLQLEPVLIRRLLNSPAAVLSELGIVFSPSTWSLLETRLLELLDLNSFVDDFLSRGDRNVH